MLEYQFNLNEANVADDSFDRTVTLLSQSRLNDSTWHRVLIQHSERELRLSLDRKNAFYQLKENEKLDKKTFSQPLIMGGDSVG
jgi:hypothetical protein